MQGIWPPARAPLFGAVIKIFSDNIYVSGCLSTEKALFSLAFLTTHVNFWLAHLPTATLNHPHFGRFTSNQGAFIYDEFRTPIAPWQICPSI